MPTTNIATDSPTLGSDIAEALSRIPPLWPLKYFVAVNPFVGLINRPFKDACALLQRTVGAAPLQSPAEYLAAYRAWTISQSDLEAAADSEWTPQRLVATLERAQAAPLSRPLTLSPTCSTKSARVPFGAYSSSMKSPSGALSGLMKIHGLLF